MGPGRSDRPGGRNSAEVRAIRTYTDLAWLYDVAFSWDVEAEVAWLCARLGESVGVVLEPACGSGRMFPAFMARAIRMIGIDRSATMLARAAVRVAQTRGPVPVLHEGDMADFSIEGFQADGAICPINSFAYLLSDDAAARHLACVASSLRPGGRYLVQLDLNDTEGYEPERPDATSLWTMTAAGTTVRACFAGRAYDPASCVEETIARFEVLASAHDGAEVTAAYEDSQPMRVWSWRAWSALIEASPFAEVAAFDGNRGDRPELPLGPGLESERLTWHLLERRVPSQR